MLGIVNFAKNKTLELDGENKREVMRYQWEENTYTIAYRGSIYNTDELTKILQRKDFELETNEEMEIILKLYIILGKDMMNYLNGVYGFAIWNEREKELFLVRDRFGINPLYYAKRNGNFFFAFHLKELLNCSEIKPQMDSIRNKRIIRNWSSTFSRKNTF